MRSCSVYNRVGWVMCINLERNEVHGVCVCVCVCVMGEGCLEIGVLTYKDCLARDAGEQPFRYVGWGGGGGLG